LGFVHLYSLIPSLIEAQKQSVNVIVNTPHVHDLIKPLIGCCVFRQV
jgi:hypothetical protein